MDIILIVALDNADAIGRNGTLPWHLPDDLRRFKALTTGHTILMGRRTFVSIGHPLPNRRNLVLTHDTAFTCLLYTSPSPRDGLLSRMPSSA